MQKQVSTSLDLSQGSLVTPLPLITDLLFCLAPFASCFPLHTFTFFLSPFSSLLFAERGSGGIGSTRIQHGSRYNKKQSYQLEPFFN
jgi:hypothetical protein